jgi:hypothetical protein
MWFDLPPSILKRPSLTTLALRARQQPQQLLLRKELISAAWGRGGDRHRALLGDAFSPRCSRANGAAGIGRLSSATWRRKSINQVSRAIP